MGSLANFSFKIGNFEVTPIILVFAIFILLLFIALISYRFNHRKQTKVSQYMDNECGVFNKKGLERYLSKNRKKLKNPVLMAVEIRNLDYLYINYSKRNKLMYDITNQFIEGLSKRETLGRIEFNKFILVLESKNRDQIRELCQKIETRLTDLDLEDYGNFNFFLYYGVYENVPLQDCLEDIYLTAAIIKYSNVSVNNIYYYSTEVKQALELLKKMNSEKDQDYEQNRFIPYIQPKVAMKTGKVVGGEILVRWIDENHNFKYRPNEFIPFFEDNGFVKKIDIAMLRATCSLVQTMVQRGRPDIVISVNISKILFMTPNFEQKVMEIVSEYNVRPRNVQLEITETIVMENLKYISNRIMNLRQMGFNVAMDDFGKQYSSLGSLSANPFDVIKLDMVFFKNRLSTEKDRIIVKNILDMLSKLNYEKVCEGISDRQTLDILATINQDVIIQGYCISEPIPVSQFEAFADTIFDFNYAPLDDDVEETIIETENATVRTDAIDAVITQGQNPNGGTSINISGLGSNAPVPIVDNSAEIEKMRLQMEKQMSDMERMFQSQLEEQRRAAQEAEIKRMQEEMRRMQQEREKVVVQQPDNSAIDALRREIESLKNSNNRDYRDDEIARLRRELDDARYERGRYYQQDVRYVDRDREYDLLQRQIDELKTNNNQPQQNQIDIAQLIEKLSQTQNSDARYAMEKAEANMKTLQERLDQEIKEREELEKLLNDLNNKEDDDVSETEKEKEQEEADKLLNLDISTLGDNDNDSDDDDDDDDDDEHLEKPNLSLEELEAIIKSYQDKYFDQWNEHAKEELKDGYYEVVNGLKYYKGKTKKTFIDKIKHASPEVKQLFNIVKNELMKYDGINNKLTNSYDCFYRGRKQIAKLSMTNKKLKVFLCADPTAYNERQFPHKDVSTKKAHSRTPYYTMVKSQLSVRRINKVIADIMAGDEIKENSNYKPIDYATKYKFYKSDQK